MVTDNYVSPKVKSAGMKTGKANIGSPDFKGKA
jgi:hypothetical protein